MVGDDDANEGHGPDECPEHVWQFEQVLLVAGEGATREYRCTRCDGLKSVSRSPIL